MSHGFGLILQTCFVIGALGFASIAVAQNQTDDDLSWKDRNSAVWYEDQAKKGNAEAAYLLAELYRQGVTLPKDLDRAVEWYQVAAFAGYVEAQVRLAELFRSGELGQPDYEEAARWYAAAASKGDGAAAFNLALLYENGIGLRRSLKNAKRYYEIAYNKGVGAAALNRALLDLQPPSSDMVSALVWLLRAELADVAGAKELRQDLEASLSDQERQRAYELLEQSE